MVKNTLDTGVAFAAVTSPAWMPYVEMVKTGLEYILPLAGFIYLLINIWNGLLAAKSKKLDHQIKIQEIQKNK